MKILLVTTTQFGYLVDYYRYYGYLKKKGYDVKYICIDYGHEKIENGNPDIHYINGQGNKLLRHFKFINGIKKLEKEYQFDRIMLHVFPLITSLLLLIPRHKMYIDIRTISIHNKLYKRLFFDFLMKIASVCFKHTSTITDTAAQQLGIKKYKLLPVGGASFTSDEKEVPYNQEYREIFANGDYVFLYVGTLNKRNIIDCVIGFHSFVKKNPSAKVRFVIIGTTNGRELQDINDYIELNNLRNKVHTLGYIPQSKLSYFFNNTHCGISYMPLSMPFSKQPNTKTYEYLVNGLPVIAIASTDNLQILGSSKAPCGVIIEDSAEGFEHGVNQVFESRHLYQREQIAREFNKYEWDNIFSIYLNNALALSAS